MAKKKRERYGKKSKVEVEIGDKMADGTIFAGELADGKALYALPEDSPGPITLEAAKKIARNMKSKKADDLSEWHVPDMEELNTLFNNQNEKSLSGSFNGNTYWTSSMDQSGNLARSFSFNTSKGMSDMVSKHNKNSVRLVRTGPFPL